MTKTGDLDKLRELTASLPPLLPDLIGRDEDRYIEYTPAGGGTFIGFGLFKPGNALVAVQRVFMSAGTVVPSHMHKEVELGLVYRGKLEIDVDGKKSTIGVGDYVYLKPHEPHSAVAVEDTWMIFTTVPAGEGYPNSE